MGGGLNVNADFRLRRGGRSNNADISADVIREWPPIDVGEIKAKSNSSEMPLSTDDPKGKFC